ncbi:MAG: HEAT repeat domain-containing protein [Gammaproteobacteria bacterium]|nr:HEAT repeat domain-containing protein [Gammaproteobacteria bacterium]
MKKYQNLARVTLIASAFVAAAYYLVYYEEEIPTEFSKNEQKPNIQTTPNTFTNIDIQPVSVGLNSSDLLYKPNFNKNEELAFDFVSQANGWLDSSKLIIGNSTSTQSDIDLYSYGVLILHVYEKHEKYWEFGGFIRIRTLNINNAPVSYIDDLANPFSFKLKNNGEIYAINIHNEATADASQYIQQTIRQFQFISPIDKRSQWAVQESDHLGKYVASYKNFNIHQDQLWQMEKQRTKYLQLFSNGIARTNIEIPESLTNLQIDTKTGWINAIKGEEKTQTFVDGTIFSEVKGKFTAKRTQRYAAFKFPDSFTQLNSALNKTKTLDFSSLKTIPELDALALGKSPDEAIEFYISQLLDPNFENLARDFMINYLRKNPDASTSIITKLNMQNSGLVQREELFLWYAIAKAGMKENQAALLATAMDRYSADSTRSRALAAMHSIDVPSKLTIDGLWQLSENSVEYQDITLFALGSLAHPSKASVESNPEHIVDQLSNKLAQSSDEEQLVVLLHSLKNSQNPASISTIAIFLGHSSEDVRSAAYQAIATIESSDAFDTFTAHFSQEKSYSVKAAGVLALVPFSGNLEISNWSKDQLQKEIDQGAESATLQIALIDVIANATSIYPENESFLLSIANQKLELKVKERIFKYVSPDPNSI